MALGVGEHRRDKPGLLATQPGAELRLCLRGLPPSWGVSLALERSDVLPMSNVTLGCEAGGSHCLCPHELLSNGDWTLLYRGKGSRRATENYMHRVFGSRRGLAGDGKGEAWPRSPDGSCTCSTYRCLCGSLLSEGDLHTCTDAVGPRGAMTQHHT